MVSVDQIIHLKNEEIDRSRWDTCVRQATNHSPFALSEYLDTLCPNWEALILGAYEMVMPLPIRKKYGIRYLYQPFLVPYLGVFGTSVNKPITDRFIDSIPNSIRWIDVTINPGCTFYKDTPNIHPRTNFFLRLNKPYSNLRAHYRENHLRNLQRAQKAGFQTDRSVNPGEIFALAESYLGPRGLFPHQYKDDFLALMDQWIAQGLACAYGMRMNGHLLAAALFLTFNKRAYYLLVGNHPDGKTLGASHALIDAFIQDHAGGDWTLDFEGSDVSSLAFFYEGFGSEKEIYGWLTINRLPTWINWIKSRINGL